MQADLRWGWTSYKYMRWARAEGRRLYRAIFETLATEEYRREVVYFWAKHPILALMHIVESGEEPATFEGQEIN